MDANSLPVITTPRVVLRWISEDDIDGLYDVFSDPQVARYWSAPPLANREAAAEMQRMEREIRRPSRPAAQPRVNTRPLRDDERCIDGQRFRRIENGWLQAGTCRS